MRNSFHCTASLHCQPPWLRSLHRSLSSNLASIFVWSPSFSPLHHWLSVSFSNSPFRNPHSSLIAIFILLSPPSLPPSLLLTAEPVAAGRGRFLRRRSLKNCRKSMSTLPREPGIFHRKICDSATGYSIISERFHILLLQIVVWFRVFVSFVFSLCCWLGFASVWIWGGWLSGAWVGGAVH